MSGFVVANPGAVAEMPMIAAGLAEVGALRTYIAPFRAPAESGRLLRNVPAALRDRALTELRRRQPPAAIPLARVERAGTALEATWVAASRAGFPRLVMHPLLRARNETFDRAVANRIRNSDHGFVGPSTSAQHGLERARALGIPSALECPTPHQRFIESILLQEARLEPHYASTLPVQRQPAWLRHRSDREYRLADRLIVLSTFQRETFLAAGHDEDRIDVVPLGVDVEAFSPAGYPEVDPFRVLFVGRITQAKGISYLIKAFGKLGISRSELVLMGRIVGSNAPWRNERGVRHVPHVARWMLPEHYRAAHVFVLPSLVEGFPLTALEAMACGVPPIVSEHTFGRDIIKDGVNGYVVPIRDPGAIAERLEHLQRDPDARRAMGAAARRTAEQLSWAAFGRRVATLLTESRS